MWNKNEIIQGMKGSIWIKRKLNSAMAKIEI